MSSLHARPMPVRPHNRFMRDKVCDSGVDPAANFTRMLKNEGTLDAFRTDRLGKKTISESPIPKGKVPYGTTKCTYKLGLSTDAKLDRYSMGIVTKSFPKNPTDKFTGEAIPVTRPFQGIFDQMVRQPDFDKNAVSPKPWVPRATQTLTINNRSCSGMNIINHEPNVHSSPLDKYTMSTKNHNRLKGITEIRDLMQP